MSGPWKKIKDLTEEELSNGLNVLLYSKEWINEDFCHDGILNGFWNGDEWVTAPIDSEGEFYCSYDDQPTHWCLHPAPPEEE